MPFSGTLSRIASLTRTVTGSLGTLSGTTTKKVSKKLSGSLGALTGSLSSTVVDTFDLSGSLGQLSGALSRKVSYTHALGGSLSMSGTLTRKVSTSTAGVLSFSGGVEATAGEIFTQSVAGILNMSGSVSTHFTEGRPIPGGMSKIKLQMKLR